jgi:hypothetical protein
VTVELPAGWQRAAESLTPDLSDPLEVLSVGTFPLRYRTVGCSHMPSSAMEDIGPRDAFITLMERGRDERSEWPEFPQRPGRFGPSLGAGSEGIECVPGKPFRDHWFGFTDAWRHFHTLVVFGPDAPPEVQDAAWRVLDSLVVDPDARPTWRSSG